MLNAPPREKEWVSWLYVGLWTLVIYVTIPFARALQTYVAAHMGRTIFGEVVLVFIALFVGGMAIYVARVARLGGWRRELWLASVALAYLYYLWRLRANPEEALHFIEYGILGLLIYRALTHRMRNRLIYAEAVLIAAILGTLDEVIQWLTPRRFWDIRDVWLNAVSALLMLVAVGKGLRPSVVSLKVIPRSVRLVCRTAIVLTILLGLCFINTPPRIAWYADRIPGFGFLKVNDSVMTEYGYRHEDPEIGAFYSRFTLEELRRQDATRAVEASGILDRFRRADQYGDFLSEYTPMVDPFVHEARVHMFRRDHYLGATWRHTKDGMEGYHATVAYRENLILEKYFSNTLARSRCRLKPRDKAGLENKLIEMAYTSPVSAGVFTRFRERHVWSVVLLLCGVLMVVDFRFGRSRARNGETNGT
ncbi:MAG: VanZ family protein [Kiritimatiellae bacterium]|nr:VanZ family protein [Kiritimatiellia bacterium]